MTMPSPGAVTDIPQVRAEGINTFDQALDQRRRADASGLSIPNELWDLGDLALRLSDRLRIEAPVSAPPGPEAPSAVTYSAPIDGPKADNVLDRAVQLIDRSFGFAVLTQQLVRSANQVANGLMTLLRSN